MVEVKQHFQISLLCWITHIWDSFMSISNLTVHSFLLLNNCPFYECIQLSHRLNDRTVSWLSFWVRINQAHFRHWHAGICFPSLAFIKHLLLFYNFSITAPLFSDFLLFVCGHPHAGRFPCPVFGLMSMSLLKASFIYICVSSMPASPCSFHAIHFVPLALQATQNDPFKSLHDSPVPALSNPVVTFLLPFHMNSGFSFPECVATERQT